jgi:hypothetical protein
VADAVRARMSKQSTHPKVARALDPIRREANRAPLRQILSEVQQSALLEGLPADLAEQFGGLLFP